MYTYFRNDFKLAYNIEFDILWSQVQNETYEHRLFSLLCYRINFYSISISFVKIQSYDKTHKHLHFFILQV